MHGGDDYLAGLAQIHTRDSLDDRRSLWRQGMASLAAAAADQQPTPLEGMATDQFWPVCVARFLPVWSTICRFSPGPWRRRRCSNWRVPCRKVPRSANSAVACWFRLHEGDAATFVTLATALALSSPRALGGAQIRARVALSLRLPLATGAHVDGLALALVSRPELERGWLTAHSMGALPARRLAARLLERAAREAARRAKEGDDSGVRVFERPCRCARPGPGLSPTASRWCGGTWRSRAGLLAVAAPMRAAEIERDLSPRLGPSEWRRAATSLAATVVARPEHGVARLPEACCKASCKRATVASPRP